MPEETQMTSNENESIDSSIQEEVQTNESNETGNSSNETEVQNNLYDLPDGRKVDGNTLSQEYRNLMSEFTRRSQKLSEYEKTKQETPREWESPDWTPGTYGELINKTKEIIFNEMQAKEEAEKSKQAELDNYISSTVKELKAIDPKLDENSLFTHANKYQIYDLKIAYNNMKDMQKAIQLTEKKVVDNIKKRDESISVNSNQNVPSNGVSYNGDYSSLSPVEYLKRIRN